MKLIISLFVFLFSVATFACPTLTGSYQCKDPDGVFISKISQTKKGSSHQYSLTERGKTETFLVDNQWRPKDIDSETKGKVRYSCSGKSLIFEMQDTQGIFKMKGTTKKIGSNLQTEIQFFIQNKEQPKKVVKCTTI